MKKVTIYTDGACSGNPGVGGWGAILFYNEFKKEISGYCDLTTNNRMELTAAIEALNLLKEPCEVDLYSDSAYLVNAFNEKWIYGWKKKDFKKGENDIPNKDLWQILYDNHNKHKINFIKVKGHADNEFNNRCDKLATDAIKDCKKERQQ
ncbi:MAG: ribonuclease HI [Clostridiales bacterium]|nr:ribonuclease HI [Clostridiales bacterium]